MAVISIFNWVQPIGWEWLLLLVMGILTQIAQINMTKALQLVEVNEITGLKYLGVIFALGFDYFLFDHRYSNLVLLGMFMVVGGVVLNLLFKAYLKRRRTQSLH